MGSDTRCGSMKLDGPRSRSCGSTTRLSRPGARPRDHHLCVECGRELPLGAYYFVDGRMICRACYESPDDVQHETRGQAVACVVAVLLPLAFFASALAVRYWIWG